jgi:hypothetical protein
MHWILTDRGAKAWALVFFLFPFLPLNRLDRQIRRCRHGKRSPESFEHSPASIEG